MNTYEPVIGLEIHARIKTNTKLFCHCVNAAVPEEPNKYTCPICMGFPGCLPVLNEEATTLALRAAKAFQMDIQEHVVFDRKSYFYPDLPMGYQITQFYHPLALNGSVEIEDGQGGTRVVSMERIHVENDAGKLMHYLHGSFVDYNRSGIPLMEIVSCPDLFSASDAVNYAKAVQGILRAIGSADGDMEKGMLRFDLNISLRKVGVKELGSKVEVKNLNSFKSLEKAVEFEIARQTALLDANEVVAQETRGFEDGTGETKSQRSKEGAADYRYFPEPDIPPLSITPDQINSIIIPELPLAKKHRFIAEYGLDVTSASLLIEQEELGEYFMHVVELTTDPKATAPWITSVLLAKLNETKDKISSLRFEPEDVAMIISLVANNTISNLNGKETFAIMYNTGNKPEAIIKHHGFVQVSDDSSLNTLIIDVIASHPAQLAEYQSGKEALLGFFVGKVMAESKGKANPKKVKELLISALA